MSGTNNFESWLSNRLVEFNADGEVFSAYILGILDGDESHGEKESNLSQGEHVQLGGPGDHRGDPLHRQADAQGSQDLHLALL